MLLTLPMVLPPTVVGYFLLLLFGAKRPLGIFFMLLEKTPDGERLRPEFIMLRSYSLCGGRIVGALITLLFPVSAAGSVAAICVLTLSQYLTVLVYRRTTALCAQA